MASTLVLLLHLLLVSLGSASHNFGGLVTYSYKGKNPDGSFNVSRSFIGQSDGASRCICWLWFVVVFYLLCYSLVI